MALEAPKYLPEDVLRTILSKLALKHVIRCRCVCKTWNEIISTNSFAKTHLITYQNSPSNSNNSMLYQVGGLCTLLIHSHSIYDGTLKHSKLYNRYHILRRYDGTKYSRIYWICNGLLCLSSHDYHIGRDIYLWNPTCRKIKKLPQPDNSIKDATVGYEARKICLSFGYYDDDFKVIVIAPLGNAYIVLVYGLNTNSWNMVRIKFEFHDDVFVNDDFYRCYRVNETKFVDGTVYIIESDHVRCFDLSNKTIRVIPFPKEMDRCSIRCDGTTDFTTETYGESIAVFKFQRYGSRSLTMWILEDKSSFALAWEKTLDEIKDHSYYLVGLLNNGKYLVSWKEQGPKKCYSCDPESPSLRKVTFMRGSPYAQGRTHSNYVESLFLLNEYHLDPIVFYDINGNSLPESAV